MFAEYHSTITALFFIILTIIVQELVATIAHRKQKSYVPGVLADNLGHESFVFRSHRTHQNSLENVIQLIVPAILAMFIGVAPFSLALVLWLFAIARVIHMLLYYVIATEKNPSPRSYFYMIVFFWQTCIF
jgi:uncharacterized MAPEG superfamily protein